MKALSIHQPWAWAILHAGKNVENRRWLTNHRGPLLIHASKSRASYDRQDVVRWQRAFSVILPPWGELTKGALLGVVELVDCVRSDPSLLTEPSVWAQGPVCWMLANPQPFLAPIPFRGAQLLFEVPDDLIKAELHR